MRQDHHDELGLLISAATQWRAAGANAGVQIDRIETTFPDGSKVDLVWLAAESETEGDSGWSGWNIFMR